jgi:pectate lyase
MLRKLFVLGTMLFSVIANASVLEGFGTETNGGYLGDTFVVSSLADSGPGTLRDAVSQSNRHITFGVEGTIYLNETIWIESDSLTIDGEGKITIAPASESVDDALIAIYRTNDIIMKNLRIGDAPDPETGDNLRIYRDCYNIVIDHCSFRRPGDGNLDISDGCHDITVQWCILGDVYKNSLIRTDTYNVTLHHNLYVLGDERNPQCDDVLLVDMINNVIYGWSGNYGTRFRNGTAGNIIKNKYVPDSGSDKGDAIILDGDGGVYMEGNLIPPECPTVGTFGTRYITPQVTETDAETAFWAVVSGAGAQPLDETDINLITVVISTNVGDTQRWGSIKALYR